MHFEFFSEGFEKHVCKSTRKGDWFIFECPDCGYLRHWNPKTKEINLVESGDENALHSGSYEPVGLQSSTYNPN